AAFQPPAADQQDRRQWVTGLDLLEVGRHVRVVRRQHWEPARTFQVLGLLLRLGRLPQRRDELFNLLLREDECQVVGGGRIVMFRGLSLPLQASHGGRITAHAAAASSTPGGIGIWSSRGQSIRVKAKIAEMETSSRRRVLGSLQARVKMLSKWL